MIGKKWLFLLPLGGILTALTLVFPQIGLLEWVTMTPALVWLFAAARREEKMKLRAFLGAGWLYFLPFYLVIYHWFFYLYPMEFAGVSPAMAAGLVAICWLGLSVLQSIFSALIFPLFGALMRTKTMIRWPFLTPFLFAAQYTVSEWSQTFTWMGVPWARLPLGQIECGFLPNGAALFGSYLLTFLLVCANGFLAWFLLHREKWRFCAIGAASVLLFGVAAGGIGYAVTAPEKGRAIVVAAVQGNIGSSQKWDGESNLKTLEIYEKYTAEAALQGAELVLFPETFLPYTLKEGNWVAEFVQELAVKYDITIMCGAFHAEGDARYNGVFTVFPDGTISQTVYAKRRLVPFGEFVPWRAVIEVVFPPLAQINMLSRDLTPGEGPALVQTPFGQVGGLICFDSIYESLTLDSVRAGADLLVLPTNDSWFLDSAAVYMHSAQARYRAIESGRWIVRSADTGISSIIDPHGNSHVQLDPLVPGVSVYTAYVSNARTPYSYIGNLIVYLMIAALLALPAYELVYQLKNKKQAKIAESEEPQ
ncbi:MAG: apolipoprotein N-acyltransferase [Ruminococcaceae bacterium]|nr:apolipoprotein N-acyltransferase [Oscillospiraceae bacterium]